jgi:formylglycine-generating enzyme required for sulfatase activity
LSGGLVITSEPSGALVKNVAGDTLGETPAELKGLIAGAGWRGMLELAGYVSAEAEADVVSGETKLVPPVKLVPAAQKIVLTSEPPGAEVVEGGKVVGSTPWESAPREVGGIVILTLQKPGYDDTGLSSIIPFGKPLILQGTLKATQQQIVINSEPTGAEVVEGRTVLGKTPLELGRQEPGKAVTYALRLNGYEEGLVTGKVKTGEALRLSIALKALPKPKMEGSKAGEERDFEIAPGVKITMCWIPPGEFIMGSPVGELGRGDDETQRRVRISKGFWLAKTETTQAQWRAVMGSNPSDLSGDDLPVESVSWNDIARPGGFIEKSNQATAVGEGRFSLPTEAQREYACRAGETGPYSGGTIDQVAWYSYNSDAKTHPVGSKKPNAWGLHDMHGNVWEWCADWYGNELSGGIDPQGASTGVSRVNRGGSWLSNAAYCRAADRNWYYPDYRSNHLGFRPALVPSEKQDK